MQEIKNKTSKAQLEASKRYIAQKIDIIQAKLPKGYAEKVDKIAKKPAQAKRK